MSEFLERNRGDCWVKRPVEGREDVFVVMVRGVGGKPAHMGVEINPRLGERLGLLLI